MSPKVEGADPVRTDDASPHPRDWPTDFAAAVWLGQRLRREFGRATAGMRAITPDDLKRRSR